MVIMLQRPSNIYFLSAVHILSTSTFRQIIYPITIDVTVNELSAQCAYGTSDRLTHGELTNTSIMKTVASSVAIEE